MKHLAQLIQLLAQKAHTISRLFIDKAFDGFELEDRRAHALAGLVMEVMRKTKPFLLLRAHDAATEIVPFGRALIDQIMCAYEGLPQFIHFLNFNRRYDQRPRQSQTHGRIAQCAN